MRHIHTDFVILGSKQNSIILAQWAIGRHQHSLLVLDDAHPRSTLKRAESGSLSPLILTDRILKIDAKAVPLRLIGIGAEYTCNLLAFAVEAPKRYGYEAIAINGRHRLQLDELAFLGDDKKSLDQALECCGIARKISLIQRQTRDMGARVIRRYLGKIHRS
jgi:hypothetical protein